MVYHYPRPMGLVLTTTTRGQDPRADLEALEANIRVQKARHERWLQMAEEARRTLLEAASREESG